MTYKPLPDGLYRMGNCTVNRIGDWFTFVEAKGKTTVLSREKLLLETFKPTIGFLRKTKTKIDNQHYFEIFERTFDTYVGYVDKKDVEESFSFEVESFEEAIDKLMEFELVDETVLDKIAEKNKKATTVKKTSKTSDNIILDDVNLITYSGKDRGQGMMYEIFWMKEGKQHKHEKTENSDEVMPFVTAWIKEYEEAKSTD